MKKVKIVIHGDTFFSRKFIAKTEYLFDVIMIFDRNIQKDGKEFMGIPISCNISKIINLDFDWIFVATIDFCGVQDEYAKTFHIPHTKIRSILHVHQSPKFHLFCSLANEIYRKQVPGSVAELGVNWGDTAKYVNLFFHNRQLYLFDTFRGFAEADENTERHNAIFDHTATPDAVLDKMFYPHNCVIKAGYFPDSLGVLEERFAFVHIDCDLYKPIISGLDYFYPRLSNGGYICVHDYYNERFVCARQAVRDFSGQHGISFVPIDDYDGIVITKT